MPEFQVGDFVQIVVKPDGAVFTGVLIDFTPAFITLSGPRAFPAEDVMTMNLAHDITAGRSTCFRVQMV
jgi:hypothetical protein